MLPLPPPLPWSDGPVVTTWPFSKNIAAIKPARENETSYYTANGTFSHLLDWQHHWQANKNSSDARQQMRHRQGAAGWTPAAHHNITRSQKVRRLARTRWLFCV